MDIRIFIGSSEEQIKFANAVQANLEKAGVTSVWTQEKWKLSFSTMDTIDTFLDKFDFGIFIFMPDDEIIYRTKNYKIVRDNVVFEAGCFFGKLGRERVFLIYPENIENIHLPTDIEKLTLATFVYDPELENLRARLGSACSKILDSIDEIVSRDNTLHPKMKLKIEKILLQAINDCSEKTGVVNTDFGIHFWRKEKVIGDTEPVLVRRARVRLDDITPSEKIQYHKGVGVVGQCWDLQTDIQVNLRNQKYMQCLNSEKKWKQLSDREKIGLDYEGFKYASTKFNSIIATPIVRGEEFIGCISINIERTSSIQYSNKMVENIIKVLRRTSEIINLLLDE